MIFKSDEKPEQPAGQRVPYTSYCNGNIRGHWDKLDPFSRSKTRRLNSPCRFLSMNTDAPNNYKLQLITMVGRKLRTDRSLQK